MRSLFDALDPCAVLLHPNAGPYSCDGYLEHAERLSGADMQEPGWLKLAHALSRRECTRCGAVTRMVAWRADGGPADGLQRCCPGCSLPSAVGNKVEASLINEQLFSRTPAYYVDAAAHDPRRACELLQGIIFMAKDGDTIGLRGLVKYNGNMGEPDGAFAVMETAIRIVGLPNPPTMPANAIAGEPSSGIYVRGNCIELYAPGVMLENLSLRSGVAMEEWAEEWEQGFPPSRYAALNIFTGTAADPLAFGPPASIILKRCAVHGTCGSSLVMGVGARCAVLQSTFAATNFLHVFANSDAVLRIHGCQLHPTLDALIGLTGSQSEADVKAVENSNIMPTDAKLLDSSAALEPGHSATRLLA